jgi:hypothetical protein
MSKEEMVIQAKVNEFTDREDAFTSVDIANAIKKDGMWIRNRIVAAWLRSDFDVDDYEKTMIDVGSGRQAFLYHPDFYDSVNYTGQDQKAINPDDFQELHPDADDVVTTIDLSNDDEEEQDFGEDSRTVSVSKGRIWVPASIITQLGMNVPGEEVDNSKLDLSGDPKLIVHEDCRISVASKDVNSGTFIDSDKIVVSIKNGKAVFEKS